MCQAAQNVRADSPPLERTAGNSPRGSLAAPDFPLRLSGACAGGRAPARRCAAPPGRPLRLRGCRPAAAVRSTPPHCAAGSGAERFSAASSCPAIRGGRISTGGACRDGRRVTHPLLAAGAAGFEPKRHFPACGAGRRGPTCTRPNGGPQGDQNRAVEVLAG